MMKKMALALIAAAFTMGAGSALACNDPECPHPPKPPKITVDCNDPECPHPPKPPKATIACNDPECPHPPKPPKALA
ncbi:hypothetical protein J7643_00155 [bacterium]|nr:hypothetical protein [bacterium]